jgi:pyruvoyl-dependent arginine decarboxylase (PvlArgDC)
LIGTGLDRNDERVVSYDDALALAQSLGCKYVECSSKTPENLDPIHEFIFHLVREHKPGKFIKQMKSSRKVTNERGL